MATLQIAILLIVVVGSFSYPEQGVFDGSIKTQMGYVGFTKTTFKNTKIKLVVTCEESDNAEGTQYIVGWLLRYTPCSETYNAVIMDEAAFAGYYNNPRYIQQNEPKIDYQTSADQAIHTCGEHTTLTDESNLLHRILEVFNTNTIPSKATNMTATARSAIDGEKEAVKDGGKKKDGTRKKREDEDNDKKDDGAAAKEDDAAPKDDDAAHKDDDAAQKDADAAQKDADAASGDVVDSTTPVVVVTKASPHKNADNSNRVTTTWRDGTYLFVVYIETLTAEQKKVEFTVHVEMHSSKGYISAIDYPLLIFYAVMCVVYSFLALTWLFCSACQWKDLLRIQFWIGGVLLLGLLEKAVFLGEYQHVAAHGKSVGGAVIFAELVSSLKRTVARMLVVIVSLGFGIVKPRLGPMLHRILGVGALYFILGSIEGCLRAVRTKEDPSKQALLASIPLAVLDAAICWWIFTSLVQTTRTLRLRRNVVKLSLYRHFTNTLIFCVVAALIFMIWSIKAHKFTDCLTDWKELWIDEAYWHLLFVIVLLVIMVLWRPTANNQRYAFSPLTDMAESEDEESKEPMMNDAFEGIKLRGVGGKVNGSPRIPMSPESKTDADLKWVEENIPQSVADAALPSLLDSDEEIMTTKFEMSKME